MVKNTGIPENQLSDLDYPQVLQDAHRKSAHCLDVNVINSTISVPYSTFTVTRDPNNCNRITQVEYFGGGTKEIQDVLISNNPQGKAEITTFSLIGKTPAELSSTYATIYDDVGSVGILFRLDGGSTGTSGADRDITVDIATGDTAADMATKLSTTMNSDSKFSASTVPGLAVVQSSTLGNKTDATAGDSGIGVAITAGYDTIEGKFFYVNKYDDSEKYTFYYTIDGSGSAPSHSGASITAIDIASSDGTGQVATKTAAVVNANVYVSSSATDSTFRINYGVAGDTTGFEDADAGFSVTVVQAGADLESVLILIPIYGDCGEIIDFEKVEF